jgi:hypothetical protein
MNKMNLQENIERIQEMMGLITESDINDDAETTEYARTLANARKQGVGLRFPKSAIKGNPQRFRYYTRQDTNEGEQNETELTEKCWPGYTQKGMKTMFDKEYPNCVKKKKKK